MAGNGWRRGVLLLGACIALCCASATAGAAARRGTQSLPVVPAALASPSLSAIKCRSATHCLAVGTAVDGTAHVGITVALAGRTPGAPQFTTGLSALVSVACRSATLCEAIGYTQAGATLHYAIVPLVNGKAGTPQFVSGVLWNVACATSTTCYAVGSASTKPFTGHGVAIPIVNGVAGEAVADTNVNSLDAITCTRPTVCEAVGTFIDRTRPELEQEEGKLAAIVDGVPHAAKMLPFDTPADISCQGTTCEAVGNCDPCGFGYGAAVHVQNNRVGTIRPVHNADLGGISCAATTVCVAVGQDERNGASGPVAVTITNGKPGTTHDDFGLGENAAFERVSCPNTTDCFTVTAGFFVPITRGTPGSPIRVTT